MGVDIDVAWLEREIRKHLSPVGSGVRFSFPILKVDAEKREILGVATTEDLDSSGEILDYEGSKAAFKAWGLNLREMHQPVAVGKALSVECDDSRRAISVRAFVSKGAEPTWQKILDGTLRAYSVGGERLKSDLRADGTRLTTAWTMTELSVVDSPANPAAKIEIAKILRRGDEMDRFRLAVAIESVARQLAAGCMPLAYEVQRCLSLAGSVARCDTIAARPWVTLGPPMSQTLSTLARGLRMAEATDEQIQKVIGAVPRALLPLLPTGGTGRSAGSDVGRLQKSAGDSVPTADELREEIAKALRQLDSSGISRDSADYRDIRNTLETDLLKLRGPGAAAGGALAKRAGPTLAELAAMEETLHEELRKWNESGMPQTPAYHELSQTYFKVCQRRKAADRRAMAGR